MCCDQIASSIIAETVGVSTSPCRGTSRISITDGCCPQRVCDHLTIIRFCYNSSHTCWRTPIGRKRSLYDSVDSTHIFYSLRISWLLDISCVCRETSGCEDGDDSHDHHEFYEGESFLFFHKNEYIAPPPMSIFGKLLKGWFVVLSRYRHSGRRRWNHLRPGIQDIYSRSTFYWNDFMTWIPPPKADKLSALVPRSSLQPPRWSGMTGSKPENDENGRIKRAKTK